MPELPEVETIRVDLQKTLVGKKILGVWTDSPKQLQPSLEAVKKNVVGKTIVGVDRRAKLIILKLASSLQSLASSFLVIHLKLTGRLLVRKQDDPKDGGQHITFKVKSQKLKVKSGDLELRFCDLRKFGWIRLIDNEKELEKLLSEFGPEPFVGQTSSGQALLTLEKFREILSKWGRPIKILLMDQEKIAGVGNIYANEALFLAGIAPQKRARDLVQKEPERVKKLYDSLSQVLKEGIKYRGASDQAYLDVFGEKGHYQEHFRVYGRKGEPCPNKCGGIIRRMTLGGRGTFFCPKCQH